MTITKEMSIGQVLSLDKQCAPVFMQHGLFCLGCPHAAAESLEEAAMVHGIEADALIQDLNEYFANKEKD